MGRNLPLVKQSTARSVSQKSGHTPPHHEVGSYHAVGLGSATEENQLIGCAYLRRNQASATRLARTTVTPRSGLQRDLSRNRYNVIIVYAMVKIASLMWLNNDPKK